MSLRKDIENDIYELFNDLDPSGKNTMRMKEFFNKMDDKKFFKYAKEFFEDEDNNFRIAYIPFEHSMTFDKINKIADKHGIPLYEYMYMPYLTGDAENPPGTLHKMLIGDIPIKRLQQMLFKKNQTSVNITKRNPETGQVTDSDKSSRVTDVEVYSLIVQNQNNAALEFYGPKADDMKMKSRMLKDIQRNGETSLENLESDTINKMSLNTINYMFLGACMTTNLIDSTGYMLPITIKAREEKDTTIER